MVTESQRKPPPTGVSRQEFEGHSLVSFFNVVAFVTVEYFWVINFLLSGGWGKCRGMRSVIYRNMPTCQPLFLGGGSNHTFRALGEVMNPGTPRIHP